MRDSEEQEPKVRPLDSTAASEPRRRPIIGLSVGVLVVAALTTWALGSLSTTDPTRVVPSTGLAQPSPSSTSPIPAASDVPVPTTFASRPARLGLQGVSTLWAIDLATLEVSLVEEDIIDAIRRGSTIAGRRWGEILYLAPDGRADVDVLSNQVFAMGVTRNRTMALTPRPVALVPIWPGPEREGKDLVLARRALDQSEWSDIPLPDCGVAYPIAAQSADRVFAVWCTSSDDLRLFVEFPDLQFEERTTAIVGGQHGPAIVNGGDEVLIVDSTGIIWTVVLTSDANVDQTGSLQLETGQQIPGIAARSTDGTTLFVGVANLDDLSAGRSRASRIVAYDLIAGTEKWATITPVPFESLTVAPDNTVYAYYSAEIGDSPHPDPALMAIDPNTGSADILISPLDLGMGRLLILPP